MTIQSLAQFLSRLVTVLAVFFCLLLSVTYFMHQVDRSASKEFWNDELAGLKGQVFQKPISQMLIEGVPPQSSPTPLDYIAQRLLFDIKDNFNWEEKSPEVYYRLWPNFVTSFVPLIIVILLLYDIPKDQKHSLSYLVCLLLITLIPISLLARPQIYHFAIESRPYALWNALWLLTITLFLRRKLNPYLITFILSLLSMTVTVSLFKTTFLAISFCTVLYFLNKQTLSKTLKQTTFIFTLPLLITLYYLPFTSDYAYHQPADSWDLFFEMWSNQAVIVPFMLILIIPIWKLKKQLHYLIPFFGVILMFLVGPLICYLTLQKGLYITERQYVYYDLKKIIFLIGLIKVFPVVYASIGNANLKRLFLTFILIVGFSSSINKKVIERWTNILNYEQTAKVISHEAN